MDMVAVVILAVVAGVVFLMGAVLFVVGLVQPTGRRRRRAAEPTLGFGFLIQHAWKVLFPPPGTTYPRDQRMMAGGLMLIAVAALLAIGALTAAIVEPSSNQESVPTNAPAATVR